MYVCMFVREKPASQFWWIYLQPIELKSVYTPNNGQQCMVSCVTSFLI